MLEHRLYSVTDSANEVHIDNTHHLPPLEVPSRDSDVLKLTIKVMVAQGIDVM